MKLTALFFAIATIGLFVAAVVSITKGRLGRAAVLAILGFALGGASGALVAYS
jgi:hypothetical protein